MSGHHCKKRLQATNNIRNLAAAIHVFTVRFCAAKNAKNDPKTLFECIKIGQKIKFVKITVKSREHGREKCLFLTCFMSLSQPFLKIST